MRQFTLLLENEPHGPLTEDEIAAMIAEGKLTSETLCAPVGAEDWRPLSEFFSFGSKLKVSRGKSVATESEDQAQAVRIDPDLRKKLLIYRLADAATVDGFTQSQAVTAVTERERDLQAQGDLHRRTKLMSLCVAIPLAFALGFWAPFVPSILGKIVSTGLFEPSSAKTELRNTYKSVLKMKHEVLRIEGLSFEPPTGGLALQVALENRIKIYPEKSFTLSAKYNPTRLHTEVMKGAGILGRERKVHLLKAMPEGRLLELLKDSEIGLLNPINGPQNWRNFYAAHGLELEKLIQAATLQTVPIATNNAFKLEAIPPINSSMSTQVIIEFSINGNKAYASWGAACFEQLDWLTELLPPAYFLAQEKYIVKKKVIVGEQILQATISHPYHSFVVNRTAPRWHYLAIARAEDKDLLYLAVSEKDLASTADGQVMRQSKWGATLCYATPAVSPIPAGLEAR